MAIAWLRTSWEEIGERSCGDFRIVPPGEADGSRLPWRRREEYVEATSDDSAWDGQAGLVFGVEQAADVLAGGQVEFRHCEPGELRICVECGCRYHDELEKGDHYWDGPFQYCQGSSKHCLTCWLGCGPGSEGSEAVQDNADTRPSAADGNGACSAPAESDPPWLLASSVFDRLRAKYKDDIDPDITDARIVQSGHRVWLEITWDEAGQRDVVSTQRTDLSTAIRDGLCVFLPSDTVSRNASRFVEELDAVDICMVTALFHRKASLRFCRCMPHDSQG
jgi:hypothetical protein